ncbi:MAG: heavy metal translocating P-type ATPase, partial [Cyanobacteria bacterium J06598_3]
FDEPVMLLSFILLGRALESRARFNAASALRSLIALQPTLARLVPKPSAQAAANSSQTTESGQTSSPNNAPGNAAGNAIDRTIETGDRAIETGVQIPANQVQTGDWLRVLPSEKIPADGVIVTGQTTVDESMLTGESQPVVKQIDDAVTAGSLNQSGAITLEVTRIGTDTTLAQMVQLIETAQTRKAPIQGLADLISGYFTYGVLTCAALTFAFWYVVGVPLWPEIASSVMDNAHHHAGDGASHAAMAMSGAIASKMAATTTVATVATPALRALVSLKLAIAVIVVACPCALGLATPTAILVGSGIGARQGLLIRGGDILEATRALDTLVFDKTGTLTTGHPTVTDVLPLSEACTPADLLQLAATVESGTRHPLGQAIQNAAITQKLTALPADDFQTEAGFGATATVTLSATPASTHRIFVGNWAWMDQHNCALPSRQDALIASGKATEDIQTLTKTLGEAGKTVVFIAKEQQIIGLLGIADTLRPEAKETVSELQRLGLNVQILSGDTLSAARAIAQELGIPPEHVKANVPPEGKVSTLEQIKRSGHRVGFVGDGINDAPALATADVGIALNSGTEIAMETADIVLMGDTLSDVLAAIALSQATVKKIRQNLTWAFAYNLICIPLAAGAFLPAFGLALNPGLAGGLMALSSLTVSLNSLQLKTLKLKKA